MLGRDLEGKLKGVSRSAPCKAILEFPTDADLDNAYWGGDRGIPTPRPSYAINGTR